MRRIDVPRGICGQCFADDAFYVITTDDEATNDYFLGKISANGSAKYEELGRIPFAARALAFDGSRFWTQSPRGERDRRVFPRGSVKRRFGRLRPGTLK